MATTEPGISPPAMSGEVGRHLRTVRKAKGLSRAEVARSAGLTRRELAAYERGRTPVPDSDLWCLAGSCGVDVSELLPSRDKLNVGGDFASLTVGDSVRRLRAGAGSDGLLREYLAMIYELRNLPPGTRPPMREEDLAALAEALGGTPEAIESRLAELIGASRDEAARLRVMILPPRALPPAPPMPVPPIAEFGDLTQYGSASVAPPAPIPAPSPAPPIPAMAEGAAPMAFPPAYDFAMTANTVVGDPEATARFFDAPRTDDDPFSSPPLLQGLAPLDMRAATAIVEPTLEATPEPILEATPEPTLEATPELTLEATPEPIPAPTIDPTPEAFAAPLPGPFLEPLAEASAESSVDALPTTPPGTFDPFAPPTVAPIDPFAAPPSGPPLAAVTPPGAPVDPFNPPVAFDPASFDPASFDPGAFAEDPFNPPVAYDAIPEFDSSAFAAEPVRDPFGADTPVSDPFGVELVALGSDDVPPAAYPAGNGTSPNGEDWMATWEALGQDTLGARPLSGPLADDADDPWAVLRIPVEGMVVDDGPDALAMVETVGTPDSVEAVEAVETVDAVETFEASEPADPFADAFEPPTFEPPTFEAPTFESALEETITVDELPVTDLTVPETADFDVDEPADDWFDRAAAATAALIADHRAGTSDDATALIGQDDTEAMQLETVVPEAQALETDALETDALETDALETDALETDALDTAALVEDESADDTGDAENGDAELIAAPIAGLAPIAWSLHPPAPEPAPDAPTDANEEQNESENDVPTAEPDALVTDSDAEFVTAGPDWQVGGMFPATAMADDGTLALRRADVRWALADLVANDDFAVRATVDYTSGAGFGILFRVSTDDSERITGYSFDADPIYSGGGFLLRQWHDGRQHWKPLAHAPVADSSRLYGHHTIEVTLRADLLTATVDGETVLTVRQLSRCSIESGSEPCRGGRLGVQAWSTTEVTVDRLMLANF